MRKKIRAASEKPSGVNPFSPVDWNFDNVPANELVACCYWEYARESAFIRKLWKRSWEYWKPLYLKGQWWNEPEDKKLQADLQKVQSIGYPADVFLRGIACAPDGALPDVKTLKPDEIHHATGSFPKPWQELARGERAYRAKINTDVHARQLVPFKRGFFLHANEIAKLGPSQSWTRKQLLEIRPSVIYGSGVEMTVVGINWSAFSNEEIVQSFHEWVKANRPKDLRKPDGKGSNKARDWRVALERLGMMRLLHRLRRREMAAKCPKAWKLYGKREWYKERKRAGERFHGLFPFLSKSERPLGWPTKGGRSK